MIQKKLFYKSPLGWLKLVGTEKAVTEIEFVRKSSQSDREPYACLQECVRQLSDYFSHQRKQFDLPLAAQGTKFQKKVWQALTEIPFGKTKSYAQLAAAIHHPKAQRAVGGANNKNKIAIVIPCHRVIGQNGSLTGYASGLKKKEWLLAHEKTGR